MNPINSKQVLQIHEYLIERYGGQLGLRDPALLESALAAPFQTFDGIELYIGTIPKAAKLLHGLISNHPFIDGNKRVGVTVLGVYLALEGRELIADNQNLIELGLTVAKGCEFDWILDWLKKHVA